MAFEIDQRLRNDCHLLGRLDDSFVLLMDNALFPWFILVPRTEQRAFHRLEPVLQQQLLEQINRLSRFIEQHFGVEKINTAWIGNIVDQLHIHVIGREPGDPCWPGVVWGTDQKQAYDMPRVLAIRDALQQALGDELVVPA